MKLLGFLASLVSVWKRGYSVTQGLVLCGFLSLDLILNNFFNSSCWLDHRNGLIWAFAAPVLIIICINTFMFVRALKIAKDSLEKRAKPSSEESR